MGWGVHVRDTGLGIQQPPPQFIGLLAGQFIGLDGHDDVRLLHVLKARGFDQVQQTETDGLIDRPSLQVIEYLVNPIALWVTLHSSVI